MPWTCPSCDAENELGYNICSGCKQARPGSLEGVDITAKAVLERQHVRGTGLESLLDFAANSLLAIGVAASLWASVVAGVPGLIPAGLILIGAFLNWLLLRSLAEIIRLLKRGSQLDYCGRISGSYSAVVRICGNCKARLYSDRFCNRCGSSIQDTDVPPKDGK